MNTYKLKFTRLQNEIFNLFCIKAGESLNKRQISKLLKVSPTAVAKSLPLLEKEGLIRVNKGKEINLDYVELDRNQRTMLLKRTENLKLMYQSGLLEFLEEKFPGTTIILFGSYSRGEDTIKSDIDIAIIEGKEKDVDLKKYDETLEREIRINFYPSFKEIHKYLRENIFNGIVLAGGIKL